MEVWDVKGVKSKSTKKKKSFPDCILHCSLPLFYIKFFTVEMTCK